MVPITYLVPLALTLFAGVSAGVWTYFDASSRNAVYAGTIAAIVTVFIPSILVYLYYRDRIGPRTRKRKTTESIAGAIAVGCLGAVTIGQLIASSDPAEIGLVQGILLPIGIAVGLVWMYKISPRIFNTR